MNIRFNNKKGFTLIEVMVTIAIIGIVATISIGGYLSWRPGYVFRGAIAQVQNDLNRAKMRAVQTRQQCRVVFNANGYQFLDGNQVMNSSQWGNIAANGIFTALTPWQTRSFDNFPQITILSPPTITFSPRGTASNDSLIVDHPSEGRATIAVNRVGRINITWP
jgi:prepilin-type N-terminal cleavage/methylation domain-containing protein